MFLTPVDIANRALQHLGAIRIDAVQGFSENSKNASECAFCYDKVRQAELRRNIWRFAIREAALRAIDTNTRLLAPTLWSSTATYFSGSLVTDQTGQIWQSAIPDNLGNDPLISPTWVQYFGPLSVLLYDSTTTYYPGEVVYTTPGDGTYRVYISLVNANADVPATATAWDATVTYIKDQVVTYSGTPYLSLIDFNIAQTPTSSPANWLVATTYASGNKVNGSDNVTYTSLSSGNTGNDPVSSPTFWSAGVLTPWTSVFTGGIGSLKWLQVGGAEFPAGVALAPLQIIYPLGSTALLTSVSGIATAGLRNTYRLPAGFLRRAPQDPKAGSASQLGAPSGLYYTDWLLEGDYLSTRDVGPIVLRFVADTADVARMDPLFCEGLAARLGMEVCEPITQSTAKVQMLTQEYMRSMTEARTVNGIETGAEEPPVDDFLAVRL